MSFIISLVSIAEREIHGVGADLKTVNTFSYKPYFYNMQIGHSRIGAHCQNVNGLLCKSCLSTVKAERMFIYRRWMSFPIIIVLVAELKIREFVSISPIVYGYSYKS